VEPELVEVPDHGRRFHATRRVRLGDVDAGGRLRLAALVGALQDVATDDADDAGLDRLAGVWVARRTFVRLGRPVALHDRLDLLTFCSGTGRSWAERRTRVTDGAVVVADAASLWVYVDAVTGRPIPLGPEFTERFGESAGGRRVDSRLRHGPPPGSAVRRPWPLRAGDLDILGHVNNARALEALDDELDRSSPGAIARHLSVEYRAPVNRDDTVELASTRHHEGGLEVARVWWLVAGEPRVSATVGLDEPVARASAATPTR